MNLMSRRRGRVGWRRHPAKVLYGATCIVGSNPTVSEFKPTKRWVFYFVYTFFQDIWYKLTCSLRKSSKWNYNLTCSLRKSVRWNDKYNCWGRMPNLPTLFVLLIWYNIFDSMEVLWNSKTHPLWISFSLLYQIRLKYSVNIQY